MGYALQPLLRIRLMRENRAGVELVAARQAREDAETKLEARRSELALYEKTREERRDRIYDAIIGRPISRDRLDLASEGVARIDAEGALRVDNVKRAEQDVKERVEQEAGARSRLNFATKERMKIDEHRQVWVAADAAEQEFRAENELEDFMIRKQEI